MKLCVVDIGTNSLHVIYAKIETNGSFAIIGSDKDMVELGEKTLITGFLPDEAMRETIQCLARYKYFAQRRGMDDIIVVATSAMREAKNGREFIKKIWEATRLKVHVIDGHEEARLIALAVQNSVAFHGNKALIVDIGGGSTEVIASDQKQIFWLDSLPLGSNRLRQMFPLSDPPKSKEINVLERHILDVLKSVIKKISAEKSEFKQLIGTSGTLNAVAKILAGDDVSDKSPGQLVLDFSKIKTLYTKLSALTVEERKKIKGLSKKRAPMILHGMSIIMLLMQETGIKGLVTCDKALREGVLFDYLQKNKKGFAKATDSLDLRQRSVYGLIEKYSVNLVHAEQTARLALIFFDAVSGDGKWPAKDREILQYAALLHDVGYHISFAKHHRHTRYLILHSALDGFSSDEITTMAWVASFHRREINRKNPEFLKLSEEKQNHVLRLAACLRVADALDSSHFAVIDDVKITVRGNTLVVSLVAHADAKWELLEAEKRTDLFEKMWGKRLEFVG